MRSRTWEILDDQFRKRRIAASQIKRKAKIVSCCILDLHHFFELNPPKLNLKIKNKEKISHVTF